MNTTTVRSRLLLVSLVAAVAAIALSTLGARASADDRVAPRADRVELVTSSEIVEELSATSLAVSCPAGSTAIAGGASSTNQPYTHVADSAVDSDGSGWHVAVSNQHPVDDITVHVWASCLALG